MSRRKFAVCLGLLISGWSGSAVAQESEGFSYQPGQYSVTQSPVYSQGAQQPVFQQPVYEQQPGQAAVPTHPAGFHRPVSQQYHGQVQQQFGNHGGQCGPDCNQGPSAFWTSYYRNARWPLPFRGQDVSAVTAYFDVQRENGWRMHNTVGHAMFDPRTNCLTQAGKNHIQSILRDNPSDRKVVYVLQGQNQQQTSTRVQSTELAISEILPVGDLPPVYVTDRDAPGSSGAYQTSVMQALKSSTPTPRLTSAGAGGGGGAAPSGTP
jgi:hypothetical protein